ncbi:MAG: DUF559 domain-containing protein [Prevotella sp.]
MNTRTLNEKELIMALMQVGNRTESEKRAYRYLPDCMKKCAMCNPAIAFENSPCVYFPDLFFEEEGFCVEIDGGYHYKRVRQDAHRDKVFKSNAFTTIRIKNEDLVVDVVFWQLLVTGLRKIENPVENVMLFIRELDIMIDEEIKSWTQIEVSE